MLIWTTSVHSQRQTNYISSVNNDGGGFGLSHEINAFTKQDTYIALRENVKTMGIKRKDLGLQNYFTAISFFACICFLYSKNDSFSKLNISRSKLNWFEIDFWIKESGFNIFTECEARTRWCE